MSKGGSFKPIVISYGIIILFLLLWTNVPMVSKTVHAGLDPTLGWLLNWNLTLGMLIITFFISLVSILVQKYGTDQKTLKELRSEQKKLQEESKNIASILKS